MMECKGNVSCFVFKIFHDKKVICAGCKHAIAFSFAERFTRCKNARLECVSFPLYADLMFVFAACVCVYMLIIREEDSPAEYRLQGSNKNYAGLYIKLVEILLT